MTCDIQRNRDMRMLRELEHLSLRDLGLSAQRKVNRKGILSMQRYIQGGCQEEGARCFPLVPSNRTRGNGHKQTGNSTSEEKLLYFEVEQALEEAAQRGCGVSSCSTPHFTQHSKNFASKKIRSTLVIWLGLQAVLTCLPRDPQTNQRVSFHCKMPHEKPLSLQTPTANPCSLLLKRVLILPMFTFVI